MRNLTFGILFTVLTAAAAAAAPDAFEAARLSQPGTPDTPSGEGDSAAIVCRAPQRLANSDALGPKVCMHNNVWARLTTTGKDLAPDAKSVIDRPMVNDPTGTGNPDSVACRKPQVLGSAWRLRSYGPEVCLTNAYWARLKTQHKLLAGDGLTVIDLWSVPGPVGPFGDSGLAMIPTTVVH